jgi:crossover junction endodeoxyribonuclease RusA
MSMILLSLPYPISANRYWASRVIDVHGRGMPVVYVTAEAKAYRAKVWDACLAYGIKEVIPGRIAIAIRLFPQRPQDFKTRMRKHGEAWDDDVRCIDLDNANKVLLDALKGVAFEDDKWVRRLQAERMEPDEHGSRVLVAIEQLAMPVVQQSLITEES